MDESTNAENDDTVLDESEPSEDPYTAIPSDVVRQEMDIPMTLY